MSAKTNIFNVFKIKLLNSFLVHKDITKSADFQPESLFSFSTPIRGKKLNVVFDVPDLSSNGGLLLLDALGCSFLDKITHCIPDYRNPFL